MYVDGWWARWQRYGECPYCFAETGQPCEDQRWDGKHPRWCRHPHPERKSLYYLARQAATTTTSE